MGEARLNAELSAVVPVKNLADAKQRLSPALDKNERCTLFWAMLEDVLAALIQVEGFARVFLVTRDEEVLRLAHKFGIETLVEPQNLGQTGAVNFAVSYLMQSGTGSLLTLPADIPLVSPAEIECVLAAHLPDPAVTIAPARDELGSNAVLCSPPDVLTFRFGDNSFYPHLERARASGIEPSIVKRAGLGLDIDVPDDLAEFCKQPSETKTYTYLCESGIAKRLTEGSSFVK